MILAMPGILLPLRRPPSRFLLVRPRIHVIIIVVTVIIAEAPLRRGVCAPNVPRQLQVHAAAALPEPCSSREMVLVTGGRPNSTRNFIIRDASGELKISRGGGEATAADRNSFTVFGMPRTIRRRQLERQRTGINWGRGKSLELVSLSCDISY